MGKIETCKRDCRRSVGIKYKIKPLQKMARLYPFFRNGFILRWWRKICVVKGGETKKLCPPT